MSAYRDDGESEPMPGWWESPSALLGLALGALYVITSEAMFAALAAWGG